MTATEQPSERPSGAARATVGAPPSMRQLDHPLPLGEGKGEGSFTLTPCPSPKGEGKSPGSFFSSLVASALRSPPSPLALAALVLAISALGPLAVATPPDAEPGRDATVVAPAAHAGDPATLVETGEPIHDIDKIIESLDRRAPVTAVAFSPDGTLIASGSEDHRVRVWHLATGRMVRRLEGHSSAVTAVAFSPDGNTIASAANDRTVRLWDARTGRALRTLAGHVYHVYAVAFAPHGQWLATASWDRTIALWDLQNGTLVKKLRGHSGAIRSIDFSADGKTLASGADDRTIRLWSVDTGKELRVLAGHAGPVTAVSFRPDDAWLFSGSADQTVRAWRLPDGAMMRTLGDCRAPVLSLAVSANGQILGTGCGAGGAILWDIPTNAQLRRLSGPTAESRAVAFSPDGRMVATGSEDGTIIVEDVASGRTLVSLSANVANLAAVAFSPDGATLATAARDRRVLLWQDMSGHKSLSRVLPTEPARALAFSPDGAALAIGGDDHEVALWPLADEGAVRKLAGHEGAVNALAFTPNGRTLASAGDDATVRLWHPQKNDEAKVLKGHTAPVRALAVSPDGAVVASASDDATVRVWDTASGRPLAVLRSHRAPVTSVAFSADGKLLVTGAQDRTVDVWLHAKGKLLKNWHKELSSPVVALVALGPRLAVASSDGLLTLWELAGNRQLKQSTAYADAVSALAAAPDGTAIASASRDGVLRVWDAGTLERRWSLGGSTRERWFACNDARTCWRMEHGALLGRATAQGEIVPISPSDDAHRTTLAVHWQQPEPGLELVEGRTVAIPLRIENRGAHPAYWVNVAQTVARTAASTTSLLLIPPPTLAVLGPGASTTVVCEVSALGAYENPRPHTDVLRLAITSASAEASSLAIPIAVDTPHLKLDGLTFARGDAVVAALAEVTMDRLQPVRLQGTLSLGGLQHPGIAPIALDQVLSGQDLALSFPLPDGMDVDRRSRATLTLRKSTHPAHVWTFPGRPVRIPLPTWAWTLVLGLTLVLTYVAWRLGLYARARPLGRACKRLGRWLGTAALALFKALTALVFLRTTLRSLLARLQRRGVAVTFFRLQPETQCSHFARQLGAAWSPLPGAHQPVFELQLGPDVPLNLERCLLVLPSDADALPDTLAHLDVLDGGRHTLTVVLTDATWSDLADHLRSPRQLVLFNKTVMTRVLRAPQPALAFAQMVSDQVDRAAVSLYRSALSNGQRQPFHGRKGELRRLALDLRRNYLIVGPHGIGKTSVLDELHGRLRTNPAVVCHYVSLADGDLTTALADALGSPGEPSLDVLLAQLGTDPKGKKVVVLCDDADGWAMLDAARGGTDLQALARHNQEHRCSFVLAGFLGLLHATRAVPEQRPFGEVIRLECLDTESCIELATEPMAALNVHYANAELVELITQRSGGMPGLLIAICDQVLDHLGAAGGTIDRTAVESACKSEAVVRAITAWRPRFGLQEPRLATIDQTVVLSAVFKAHFTLQELQSTLAGLGVQATPDEIEQSVERLVAACVLEQWLGYYHFRVPLFQTVMQEAALARMIVQ